jgi:hypothetical protein
MPRISGLHQASYCCAENTPRLVFMRLLAGIALMRRQDHSLKHTVLAIALLRDCLDLHSVPSNNMH